MFVAALLAALVYVHLALAAPEHRGQVTFGGVPVPGVTITATQGSKKFVAITDGEGTYGFPDAAEGLLTISVDMLGFVPMKQEVTGPAATFELKMLALPDIKAEVVHNAAAPPAVTGATAAAADAAGQRGGQRGQQAQRGQQPQRGQTGFQRTAVNASGNTSDAAPQSPDPSPTGAFANLSQQELNQRAADGLLINGTVNNGAASPFAQAAAFGNNRRGGRPLYNGNIGVVVDNSNLDARQYSLTGQNTAKPDYNKTTANFSFGGPLKIPHLIKNNGPTFFVNYQRTQNRNANTVPYRMPTPLERAGNFSQTLNPLGQPVQIIDPLTGQPFAGNVIPPDRISPQAKGLLNFYPLPNFDAGRYNYQVALVDPMHQDNLQTRMNKSINNRNQIAGNFDMQSTRSDAPSVFNFQDSTRVKGINAGIQWTTRPSQRFSATFRYGLNRLSNRTTPYFANHINVSKEMGITGNNQESPNWGPPALAFSSGIQTLSDAQYSSNRILNHIFSYNSFWNRGRHNLSFGGDVRRQQVNVLSQQDARGTFTFTGAAAGYDLADFLLGVPDTSSIAFGNADKYYRQTFYDGFIRDDWRVNGSISLDLGLRWEYESPISEQQKRLVNLNVATGFTSATPAIGNNLINPDRGGIQPRLAFAWRPIAASSLIVRGNYGIYRNSGIYQAIAGQMAQQSPLSKSFIVQNSAANPLSMAKGFVGTAGTNTNTFAIDPNFRVGFAQNWMFSIQRDLPAALQMTATYLGTRGSRLMQEILPNTYPSGAVNPCSSCQSGFVYLSSNGRSHREAAQVQLRRRLRNGFTSTVSYTLAKAMDDAPLMAGNQVVTLNQGGQSIVQNWLDREAEYSRSNFDQRHLFSVQGQYTTGAAVRSGALSTGWRGVLLREWTITSNLNVGSGLPQTPVYFAAVAGFTGSLRPDTTGTSVYAAPAGLFLNPAAYRTPAAGHWGNAGRNSINGPSQFSLNGSLGRTFRMGDRYSMDLRLDATNVLNHVTWASWTTTISSAQFGLPSRANNMRNVQTTLRLRF